MSDFEDEFDTIKQLSESELRDDKMIRRIKLERRLNQMELGAVSPLDVVDDTDTTTPQPKEPTAPKPIDPPKLVHKHRIKITGKDKFLALKKPRVDKLDIYTIRHRVLANLQGKQPDFPGLLELNLVEKYNEVYQTLQNTVKDREGHSVLIIGPRASGKSAIVERALAQLGAEFPQQYFVIRLNAYLHADDNAAVREIARQLDQNVVGEYRFEQRAISDTFTNILALLDDATSKTSGDRSAAIVFTIDEFERYTGNSKQTLLYNLFDLSQTSLIPICVIGLLTRITTRELLEKRVRSRFSQRIVTLPRPATIDEFWANAKLNLMVDDDTKRLLSHPAVADAWNSRVEALYSENTTLTRLVVQNFYTVKNYKDFNNHCIHAVSAATAEAPYLHDADFKVYPLSQPKNSVQDILAALSTLELLLVIAAARWMSKVDLHALNFNMAYKEYQEMMKALNAGSAAVTAQSALDSAVLSNIKVNHKIYLDLVLKNSWQTLYRLGLVLDVVTNSNELNAANNNLNRSFIIEELKMVQLDVTLDELNALVTDQTYRQLTRL